MRVLVNKSYFDRESGEPVILFSIYDVEPDLHFIQVCNKLPPEEELKKIFNCDRIRYAIGGDGQTYESYVRARQRPESPEYKEAMRLRAFADRLSDIYGYLDDRDLCNQGEDSIWYKNQLWRKYGPAQEYRREADRLLFKEVGTETVHVLGVDDIVRLFNVDEIL